jgi:hypothetical protein
MKLFICVVISFFFVSCVAENNYYLMRNFERNQVLTAKVSEPMLKSKLIYETDERGLTNSSVENQLIYLGKSENVIKIEYREYSNDAERHERKQELEYDISKSPTIKFRNSILEIIMATNQDITFKVIDARVLKVKQGKLSSKNRYIEVISQ